MTGNLANLFEGKEIRVMEQLGEVWLRLDDLAAAWGIDRTTPHNLIVRNKDVFEGYTLTVAVGDITSPDVWNCVNERGLYLLMGKISADRLKNPAARAALIRFQRWVPELIQRYRKKEIVQQLSPAVKTMEAEIDRARTLAELTGGDLKAFQAVALKKCGVPEYIEALHGSVIVHGEAGWYTPTQLGDRCGLNAREVNSWLYNHGFQYPQGPVWRLQPKGEPHGEEFWYTATSGHQEWRIRWRESVLYASGLKRQEPVASLPERVTAGG